jgi:nicotinate-nucleotide adenylyltransferase
MPPEPEPKLDEFLRKNLSPRRYQHSRAVAELCRELCLRFGVDPGTGYTAGLGHDAARELPENVLVREAARDGLPADPYENKKPVLLHGRVSALILKEKFGVGDKEILEAVRRHTLGHPDLSLLGKILFVADYCEPGRKFIDAAFRRRCFGLPLDGMVVYILDNEIDRGHIFAPITQVMYTKFMKAGSAK